jgi:GrpB-like predicted nucleotidyltransferase (UPF0157 family)
MVGLERGTVALSPSQSAWKQRYAEEVARLEAIAGGHFHEYEHIGSTAVKGLAAKPIIDLLAVVDDLDEAHATLVPVLEEHGYEYRPNGDVRGRLFFAKGPRSNRTHYLSLTERDSEFYAEKLAFREYLRAHPDVAAEYESLKQELANKHPNDRDAYTEQKGTFIERVLEEAIDGR